MPSVTGNLSKERRVIFRVASLCFSVTKTVVSCIKANLRFAMDDMTDFPL